MDTPATEDSALPNQQAIADLEQGQYKSVQNRAIVHKEQERQSVAAFYNLSQTQQIKPAEPLIGAEYPLCWEKWYLVNTSRPSVPKDET